jgi:hypothetical protein
MAVGAAALVLTGVLAVLPVAWRSARDLARGHRQLARPAVVTLASGVVLVVGGRHFANAWPGTGGTGALHALVPGGMAAFGWSTTLSVSSYWAHPVLLGGLPLPELAWMALSPLAWAGLVAGAVMLVRRLSLSARMLRYLAALAVAGFAAAAVFLAGGAAWLAVHGTAEPGLFRPGLVNGAELLAMAAGLLVAGRAASALRRARSALCRTA